MRGVLVVRVLSFVLAVGVLFSSPTPAQAQSSGTPTIKFGTVSALKRALPRRPNAQKPLWVSRSDCQQGDVLTYPVTMTGYSGYTLQVWAGTVDCTPAAQRVGGSGSTCWQVFGRAYTVQEQPGGGFAVPLYARNIVNNHPPELTSTQPTTNLPEADISVCNASGGTQQIALYFMLVDGSGTIANGGTAMAVWKDTAFDITPPAPPTGLVLGGGEAHINVSWTSSTDADIFGYNIYCDPPPGAVAGSADAGLLGLLPSLRTLALPDGGPSPTDGGGTDAASGTGGAGGGTSSTDGGTVRDAGRVIVTDGGEPVFTNCAPTALVAGTDPIAKYLCGHTTGNVVKEGKAENLVNGQEYVISVGAVDIVGNVGKLSKNECSSPIPVTDFFELYRDLGGQGGCSVSPRRQSSGGLLTALGAAIAVGMLRKRRRPS